MSKMTPGPWSASDYYAPEGGIRLLGAHRIYMPGATGVYVYSLGDPAEQVAATAKAIAALPKLIEALREVRTIQMESYAEIRKRQGTRIGNTLVVVNAALKEAGIEP